MARRRFKVFFRGEPEIYNIHRTKRHKNTKAEVEMRDFVHCLINENYIVVKKYSFKLRLKATRCIIRAKTLDKQQQAKYETKVIEVKFFS